jgi:PAS domain S-box-containing protein
MTTVLTNHQTVPGLATAPELLRAMADSSPDPIAVKDRNLLYIACNAAFMRQIGMREEDIIGKSDFELVSIPVAELCRESDLQVLESGEPVVREECISSDRGMRCFQVTKSPLRGAGGCIDGVVVVSRDISEQKQAEVSDQLQAERYATLLRTAHEGFWIMGTDGIIRDVNQTFCATTGYSREELLGMRISDLEAKENPEETTERIKKVIQQGYDRFETRHRRKDGMIIDVEISTSYWSPSGDFLVFCRDITERTRAEAERRRYEAELWKARKMAERESESKTRFLATASHDLRQPIQAMHLLSHLLVHTELPTESAEIAVRLQEAIDGLGDMLAALLDISKLDAGLVKPELSDFRLDEIIRQLNDEHLPLARERGIELKHVASSVYVHSDQNLLTRILRNLLSNAIKYTSSGSVLIGVRRYGAHARIQVLDTGIGIAEDELGRIFEEFHQLGNTARDRREGLGLGLAIVERLTGLLGYPLEVFSQPGRGSGFSVMVPIAAAGKEQHERLTDSQRVFSTPCEGAEILVVDDEIDIREGLEMSLRRWGYSVRVAADFDQAIDQLEEGPPPVLVIADYRLGSKTGTDVIQEVRRMRGRNISALLLTGDATEERSREAARLGVQLLRKPISGEQLRRAVFDSLWATE